MLYSTVTPSPTGLVNRSSLAGVVVAGVLVPVIVLCLLAAIAVAVIVVIYRRGLCVRDVSIEHLLLEYCKRSKSEVLPLVVYGKCL